MVESDKGRPHYVVQWEGGRVTCEDYPCFKSAKICTLSLAVSGKCSKLRNFLTWYKRSSDSLTTTSYITSDSASTVGKQNPKKLSTSRRKGGRGLAITLVPRSATTVQATPPSAAPNFTQYYLRLTWDQAQFERSHTFSLTAIAEIGPDTNYYKFVLVTATFWP